VHYYLDGSEFFFWWGGLFLGFRWRYFPESIYLTNSAHALKIWQVCLGSITNLGRFTYRATCFISCISASIAGMYFLENTYLARSVMHYLACRFDCDRSVIKGTLLGQHSGFSAVSLLPLDFFKENSYFAFLRACATNDVGLVAFVG